MKAKARAIKAAERALGPMSSAIVFGAYVRGWMAGHAQGIRGANKIVFAEREKLSRSASPRDGDVLGHARLVHAGKLPARQLDDESEE